MPDDGMARFVVGHHPAFMGIDQPVLLLQAGDDPLDGILEIGLANGRAVLARSQQRGLVAHIGDLGTGETGRLGGQVVKIDIRVQGQAARVDLENLHAAGEIGSVH